MVIVENTTSNQELSFPAAIFSSFLCVVFGANAVAIKVSLSGMGPFTTAGLRFGRDCGDKLQVKKEYALVSSKRSARAESLHEKEQLYIHRSSPD